MKQTPRLRTVNKVLPPYPLNQFPSTFIQTFGGEIAYLLATKSTMSIEGSEWEQVFAQCIGAEWRPSNVGLDDVVLGNCCWSAKTVKGTKKNIAEQKEVRLISGRCSPVYSYDSEGVSPSSDPSEVGDLVLGIWNERVSAIREVFKFARTVVLVKADKYNEFLVFETDTIRYDPEMYRFFWNTRGNLEGEDRATGQHKFTWQPHGAQLTIVEAIPPERLHIRVTVPRKLSKEEVLRVSGFNYESVKIIRP